MELLKTVGIRELKNNLSAYLREVKRGTRLLVTDRNEVVAELREPLTKELPVESNPLLAQWIREGKIIPPVLPKTPLKFPLTGLKFPEGTALKILDEDRKDKFE